MFSDSFPGKANTSESGRPHDDLTDLGHSGECSGSIGGFAGWTGVLESGTICGPCYEDLEFLNFSIFSVTRCLIKK